MRPIHLQGIFPCLCGDDLSGYIVDHEKKYLFICQCANRYIIFFGLYIAATIVADAIRGPRDARLECVKPEMAKLTTKYTRGLCAKLI